MGGAEDGKETEGHTSPHLLNCDEKTKPIPLKGCFKSKKLLGLRAYQSLNP